MKKIKEVYLPEDNFTEAIAITTDLDKIDVSDILQATLNEKNIEGANIEEVLISMANKLGTAIDNSEYKWEELTLPTTQGVG